MFDSFGTLGGSWGREGVWTIHVFTTDGLNDGQVFFFIGVSILGVMFRRCCFGDECLQEKWRQS